MNYCYTDMYMLDHDHFTSYGHPTFFFSLKNMDYDNMHYILLSSLQVL